MSEKVGAVVGIGIIAGIGVLAYTIIKEKPVFDYNKAYSDALDKIQNLHETSENVKNTLKDVADSIPKEKLNLDGVVIVANEVRDVVTTQLEKLGSSGGDTVRLFT